MVGPETPHQQPKFSLRIPEVIADQSVDFSDMMETSQISNQLCKSLNVSEHVAL